jgi:hypothetical protein
VASFTLHIAQFGDWIIVIATVVETFADEVACGIVLVIETGGMALEAE